LQGWQWLAIGTGLPGRWAVAMTACFARGSAERLQSAAWLDKSGSYFRRNFRVCGASKVQEAHG